MLTKTESIKIAFLATIVAMLVGSGLLMIAHGLSMMPGAGWVVVGFMSLCAAFAIFRMGA